MNEIPMLDKLAQIEKRYQEIENLMANPEVATDLQRLIPLGKEHASLEATMTLQSFSTKPEDSCL